MRSLRPRVDNVWVRSPQVLRGDEEEDGESEDDNEDGEGTGVAAKRPGTKRRRQRSFYFRTGAVQRTTVDNGLDVTAQCPGKFGGMSTGRKL